MLEVSDHNGVALVTIDRPPVNAFDASEFERLREVFEVDLADDPRAVVITGTGTSFSAGVDLHTVVDGDATYAQEILSSMRAAFLAVFRHPRPVVTAINGHAIAGGCIIACASDRRLMASGSGRIGVSELRVGVPFPAAAFEIARSVMGRHLADLALTARLVGANEALALGLIDVVVEPDALLDASLEEARLAAEIPAPVFAYTKRQLQRPTETLIAETGVADEAWVDGTWSDPATTHAIATFMKSTVSR